MGIFEGIEKLINEHGSATILKERLSLAADQYAALERKNAETERRAQEAEVGKLTAEVRAQNAEMRIKNLEAENRHLRLDNEQLVKEIGNLKKQLLQSISGEIAADYDPYDQKRS